MDVATPPLVRKVGRPAVKSSKKARSSSAGGKPDVASPPFESPPPQTDDKTRNNTVPPHESVAPSHSPPPTADAPSSPKTDFEDEAKKKFVKRAMVLLDDCREFIEIYGDLVLNSVLIKQLVEKSNILLERIAEFLDFNDEYSGLEDLFREAYRWKRIINTFVVSMLGKYEDPYPKPTARVPPPPPAPAQRD